MARREYARIGVDMPEEDSIKALDVGPQWLYDRLLLRPEISRCGVVPWRPAVLAELAPDATIAKITRWSRPLVAGRLIVLDEPYAECLVRTHVRHDKLLASPNVIPNLVYDFGLITSPAVRIAFLKEFRRLWDLDDFSDSERGGWLAAVGHFPRRKHGRDDTAKWPVALEADTLARIVKGVGTGLREPLTSAIGAGHVRPFDADSKHGTPDPFPPSHPGTPSPPSHPPIPSEDPTEEGISRVRAGAHRVTGKPGNRVSEEPGSRVRATGPDPDAATGEPTATAADTRTQAEQLVTQQAGRLTGAVRLALTAQTTELLDEGHDPTDIATSLADWRQRPGSGAGLLPWLLTDRLNARDTKTNGNGNGHHRPAWCGRCDETIRAEPVNPNDPHSAYRRCPRCHPQHASASNTPAASEPPKHGGVLAMSGPDDPPF